MLHKDTQILHIQQKHLVKTKAHWYNLTAHALTFQSLRCASE